MDDLRTRLAEAADQAAQLARAPGATATLRQVRVRRRRRAGGVLLVLVVVAAGAAAGRGLLTLADTPSARHPRDLAWRPLVAGEWRASVPDERPLDPVLVAAEGQEVGEPWRLVVYRSTYHPAGGRRPVADVCYLLEWFAMDAGPQPSWQLHGTCAPERQAAAVLAAGPHDRGLTAVIGRAPEAATRVRLEFRDRRPVETTTVRAGALPGRFYAVFVPLGGYLERMVALDGAGDQVGEAPGPGRLSQRQLLGYPPTGPVSVVATLPSSSLGPVEVLAWPIRDGFCVSVELDGGDGGGSSGCGDGQEALDPSMGCVGSSGVWLRLLHGGVPRAARKVTAQAEGWRVEVPTRDGGAVLDRAFFATVVPKAAARATLHVTARDGGGRVLWSRRVPGCG